jgi:hypothetical protein
MADDAGWETSDLFGLGSGGVGRDVVWNLTGRFDFNDFSKMLPTILLLPSRTMNIFGLVEIEDWRVHRSLLTWL